jgi:hypothetical protein
VPFSLLTYLYQSWIRTSPISENAQKEVTHKRQGLTPYLLVDLKSDTSDVTPRCLSYALAISTNSYPTFEGSPLETLIGPDVPWFGAPWGSSNVSAYECLGLYSCGTVMKVFVAYLVGHLDHLLRAPSWVPKLLPVIVVRSGRTSVHHNCVHKH